MSNALVDIKTSSCIFEFHLDLSLGFREVPVKPLWWLYWLLEPK
jgi:hypothetical protein